MALAADVCAVAPAAFLPSSMVTGRRYRALAEEPEPRGGGNDGHTNHAVVLAFHGDIAALKNLPRNNDRKRIVYIQRYRGSTFEKS